MAEALSYPVDLHTLFSKDDSLPKNRPLRIAVLDTAASKTGALSVLREYYDRVCGSNSSDEWFFIIGTEGLLKERKDAPFVHVLLKEDIKRSRIRRLFFDRFSGKGYLSSLKPDVILSMQNTLPRGAEKIGKTVIYLHQPLGFQKIKKFSFFNKWERGLAVYQYLIAGEIDDSLKRADKIIVQTKWMKDAVCEKDGIDPERIEIMPPALPADFDLCKPFKAGDTAADAPDDADLCKPAPGLFVYPAGSMVYKNHQCIADALKLLYDRGVRDLKVVFTEKKEDLPWVSVSPECENMMEWRGMMKREELLKLYKSSVLLFPSYIETFGLPLAEARNLGIPVIAADTPFAREILAGYEKAEFFDAFDPERLSHLMFSMLQP